MSDPHQRRMEDALVHLERGDLPRARAAAEDALRVADGPQQQASAQSRLAVVIEQQGEGAEAERLLREAIAVDPAARGDHPDRLHDLGIVLMRRGKPAEAAPFLEEAVRHAGEDDLGRARSLEVLGHAYLELSEERRAESAFAQLSFTTDRLGEPLRSLRAHNGRGEALRRMGRRPEAWAAFELVVRAMGAVEEPSPAQNEVAGIALHNLGVFSVSGDPARATSLLEGAIRCFTDAFGTRAHPHVARSVAFLGLIAADAGDARQAALRYAEARRLAPADDPVVTELLPSLEEA